MSASRVAPSLRACAAAATIAAWVGGDAGALASAPYEAAVRGNHFTIGKKVVVWDVGFGFRPLDVVQVEEPALRVREPTHRRSN
ncbi:hypothetical protein [Anaeromyxobacter sp. Fw109-5]|uniref:hypothetical protein n=1 Tax=Anaeromyxobacter sp. (strain Fw109-5) TaxID=404589 RepID=UPI00059D7B3C|nr:hypothetical protein [Anaeromyxobacter sp. Fw109-5]